MVPSSTLAGAAVSAAALARCVQGLVATLPLPETVALASARTCRRVARLDAPRITSTSDVAAIAADLIATVQALARAAEPADAAPALYEAAQAASSAHPISASPVLTRAYALSRALAAGIQTACLGEAFLAEARTDFSDRQAASAARLRITAACDAASDRIAERLGREAYEVLARVARETCGHLVQRLTTLQPVVRVEAMRSFPSTALAWSLYADPARADELVRRNRVATPLFMPPALEAVSPKA